jgi:chorismate mutase/prephenate dehydratase
MIAMQKKWSVAFLGPEGTHSHEACRRYCQDDFLPVPCASPREVMEKLDQSATPVDAAVVPVENSIEGPVTQTLDELAAHRNLRIGAAFQMRIKNHLLARDVAVPFADIRRVCSHPQAMAQCRLWLDRHLPHAERMMTASTSEAAGLAAQDATVAAVAGSSAAQVYKLAVRAEAIQDRQDNTTRFLVLYHPDRAAGFSPSCPPGVDKDVRALFYLTLPNQPGALLAALRPFNVHGVNMTFIQSRPLVNRPWEYAFFIETEKAGAPGDESRLMADLKKVTDELHCMGVYPLQQLPGEPAVRTGPEGAV